MEEFSIVGLIFKKSCKIKKKFDSNVMYIKEVLTYILRNFLNKLENCIELLTDRI